MRRLGGALTTRPSTRRTNAQQHNYDLLLSTLQNGKALRLELEGKSAAGVSSSLRGWIARHYPHLKLCVRVEGSAIYAWVANRPARPNSIFKPTLRAVGERG